MSRLVLSTVALAMLAAPVISAPALSAPLINQANAVVPPSYIAEVRIVCDENGVCARPPSRPLRARWIYGDNAFYGPYDGPRYYGAPNLRYKWSFLNPWWTW
jgi:hypothetical protein